MTMLRHRISITLAASASALALTITACGSDQPASDAPAATAQPVEVANPATIRGHIMFEGEPPVLAAIDMQSEPTCLERQGGEARQEEVLVSDGGLQNVFVYIREGLEGQSFPAPAEAAVVDQVGCIYEPRVQGVQAGQEIIIKNSDGLLHNVNATPQEQRGFNFSQPTNMETTRSFAVREVTVPFRCDVHGWMRAYVAVLEHPYFAVSAADGTFEIGNLPPGDYVVEAWHERYGTQELNVTVGPDETTDIHFTYDAQTAGGQAPTGEPLVASAQRHPNATE